MQKQIHFTEFAEFAGAEFASAFFLVFYPLCVIMNKIIIFPACFILKRQCCPYQRFYYIQENPDAFNSLINSREILNVIAQSGEVTRPLSEQRQSLCTTFL